MSDTPHRQENQHRHADLFKLLASRMTPENTLPVYLQLRHALTEAIQDGTLRPGDSLPAVRALATALDLAPNTVAKTYALLQDDGLTENRAGAGTRVRADTLTARQAGLRDLQRQVRELLTAGVSTNEVRAALAEVLKADPGGTTDLS
ncbi:GntR family transcriptional regulator [Deinococcus arenicola]|uniref:GntR family transcriptional regulator n=1 Tax=Deinococcus arenicola TaxID=2994950 RepID=A0ABU4DU41_9DEIO|nr:GntR family transcriptional regulator [Deinococcus sp. ZS9-10]MDV6375954.1 GntR family transcriptional regulator [Deinococcus sp. ZS9-10]